CHGWRDHIGSQLRMVKGQKGWTIVELLIASAIVGLIAMLAPPLITTTTKYFILGRAKLELQREARGAMYIIERELRQAQSATLSIDQAAGQPYYSRLNFTKVQGTTVTLTQTGNVLTLTAGSNISTLTKNLAYIAYTF